MIMCLMSLMSIHATTLDEIKSRGFVNCDEKDVARYSMPLFLHAKDDVVLSERYNAKSYLTERLREIGLIKD